MQTCFARTGQLVDVPTLRRMRDISRELPRGAGGDVMSHGDLISGNVLVSGGRRAGVLDVGSLGPADLALDLVAAWHLLETGPRQVFRDDLGCDDLD
jgi:aminoglycoside phosphotransferase (APT) family kinase protein